MAKNKTRIEKSSGSVFADLGLPNPEQELLKARLTLQIHKIVKARGLTQAQAGAILGIKQPHVSALMRNRAGNFSVGNLLAGAIVPALRAMRVTPMAVLKAE